MRLGSWRNRALLFAAFLAGALFATIANPLWRTMLMGWSKPRYQELTYLCDSAMRAHYQARAEAASFPSIDSARGLRQAEIALIDCQDYDLLQKRLQRWGLTEADLGEMRLEAIEADAGGLTGVIDVHEIHD